MSVLPCNRKGCENIMCDRLSSEYGYICESCFQELLHSNMDVKNFMNTEKNTLRDQKYREEYLNKEFLYR